MTIRMEALVVAAVVDEYPPQFYLRTCRLYTTKEGQS